jgi:predicted nucleic acid-binding protein
MDSRAWVVNASPLILLGKSGCLDMLAQISGKVIVPFAVKNEIAVGEGGRQIIALLKNDSRFVFS